MTDADLSVALNPLTIDDFSQTIFPSQSEEMFLIAILQAIGIISDVADVAEAAVKFGRNDKAKLSLAVALLQLLVFGVIGAFIYAILNFWTQVTNVLSWMVYGGVGFAAVMLVWIGTIHLKNRRKKREIDLSKTAPSDMPAVQSSKL